MAEQVGKKMGKKREFTDATLAKFLEALQEMQDEEWFASGVLDWLDDLFTIDVQFPWQNLSDYRKKMMDKNNTTASDIKKIWETVAQLDNLYSERSQTLKELAQAYKEKIVFLSEKLKPEEISNTLTGDTKVLTESILGINNKINQKKVKYELQAAAIIDEEGNIIGYDWKKIKEHEKEKIIAILKELGSEEGIIEQYVDWKMKDEIHTLSQKTEYSLETWRNASDDEKRKMLLACIKEIEAIYGVRLSDVYFIYEEPNEEGMIRLGFYSSGDNSVTINEYVIQEYGVEDGYDSVFDTVLHELRHAYQFAAVADSSKFEVSTETINTWRENINNYVGAEDFEAYRNQPIEVDARDFGDEWGE